MRNFETHNFYKIFLPITLLLATFQSQSASPLRELNPVPNIEVPAVIAFQGDESGRGSGRFQIVERNIGPGDLICLKRIRFRDDEVSRSAQITLASPVCNSQVTFNINVDFSAVGMTGREFLYHYQS